MAKYSFIFLQKYIICQIYCTFILHTDTQETLNMKSDKIEKTNFKNCNHSIQTKHITD